MPGTSQTRRHYRGSPSPKPVLQDCKKKNKIYMNSKMAITTYPPIVALNVN